jgi:hypothetical protein
MDLPEYLTPVLLSCKHLLSSSLWITHLQLQTGLSPGSPPSSQKYDSKVYLKEFILQKIVIHTHYKTHQCLVVLDWLLELGTMKQIYCVWTFMRG